MRGKIALAVVLVFRAAIAGAAEGSPAGGFAIPGIQVLRMVNGQVKALMAAPDTTLLAQAPVPPADRAMPASDWSRWLALSLLADPKLMFLDQSTMRAAFYQRVGPGEFKQLKIAARAVRQAALEKPEVMGRLAALRAQLTSGPLSAAGGQLCSLYDKCPLLGVLAAPAVDNTPRIK